MFLRLQIKKYYVAQKTLFHNASIVQHLLRQSCICQVKMNCFVKFLLCFHLIVSILCDESQYNSIQTINSLIKLPNWSCIVKFNVIFINGEFTTVEKWLKINNPISNETQSENSNVVISVNESNVEVVSNMMYIAVSCKYADFFDNLLRFISQCISSCQKFIEPDTNSKDRNKKNTSCLYSTLINFIDLKPYFVKAMFNLFNFKDLFQNLRYSDHTFLMSLMTINLFLERLHTNFNVHSEKVNDEKPTEENNIENNFEWFDFDNAGLYYKKVLFQMTYLIDKYRGRNCKYATAISNYTLDKKMHYDPTNDFNTIIKTTLGRSLLQWQKLNDMGFNDEKAYNAKMYDLQYLLLQKMFIVSNDFEHLFMKFNMGEQLIKYADKMFTVVEKNHNLKNVIKYQIFLIELIKSIFLVKAEYITLIEDHKNKSRAFFMLKKAFGTFINKCIPVNYLPDFYQSIVDAKNKLIYIRELSTEPLLPADIAELLRENSIIHDDGRSSFKDKSMMEFIDNLSELEHFKTFRQTFEVLLQESSALDDYNLPQPNDHEVMVNSNYANDVCNHKSAVREHLILFYVLTYQIDSHYKSIDNPKYCLTLSFQNFYKYMARIFQDPINSNLREIFLPVLIHLENKEWIFHDDDNKAILKQNVVLKKIILMAVNAIQYIAFSNCKAPELNKDIIHRTFREYADADNVLSNASARINIKNIITRLAFESRTYRYRNAEKCINNILDKYIFKDILKDANGTYAKEMQFNWYGLKKNIYQIGQDIIRSVVDYRRIVRFQCLVQKWLVSKIFIQLGYFFKFPISLTNYRTVVILKELNKLNSLKFSSSQIEIVKDTVELYTKIFEYGDISEDYIEQYHIKIEDTFETEGITLTKEYTFNTFSDLYRSWLNDIKLLSKYFLSHYNELLVFEDYHSIKMFWDKEDQVYDKETKSLQ